MPGPYKRHVFVCTFDRDPKLGRSCCGERGGADVRAALKKLVKDRGLKHDIRVNAAGCLDNCEWGVSCVVYPEGVWYRGLTLGDLDDLLDEHLIGGRPVKRLRWSGVTDPPSPPTMPSSIGAPDATTAAGPAPSETTEQIRRDQ